MAVRYLLDTNICIYIRREQPPGVLTRFRRLRPGDAAISVVTWGALLFGAERSEQRERALGAFHDFVSQVPVLPMSEDVGAAYGAIRADLAGRGTPIGNNDLWIAAHAYSERLTLVTNNEREFRRVKGLRVQNWI
jgi:tRNA(fMet)-specific endonuclease VapC